MPAYFKENTKYLLGVSLVLMLLTLITFNIQNITRGKMVLGMTTSKTQKTEESKLFWLNFVQENPTYLEAWVELALLAYEEGDLAGADEYYLKAKGVNPNSDKLPW